MSRPTRLEVVMLLEQRIAEFVESVTGEPSRPKPSLMPEHLNVDRLKQLLVYRIVKAEFVKRHLYDGHTQPCSICQQIISECGYGAETKAYQFLEMNKELLAELYLT